MSVFEWASSILGMLGFVLGIINLIWMIRKQSPRLDVDIPTARFFKARLENRIGEPYPVESREVVVLDLLITVSNISQIGNTVVSVQSEQPYEITSFDKDDKLIVGERVHDASRILGMEKQIKQDIYFAPQVSISSQTPQFLAPGSRIEGSLSAEIKNGNSALDAFNITVVVKDAHGCTYKKITQVNRKEPIDKKQYPLNEGVCPTIEVCSI